MIFEELQEDSNTRDESRLIQIAKSQILKATVEKIKAEEDRVRVEEAHTGVKHTKPLIIYI